MNLSKTIKLALLAVALSASNALASGEAVYSKGYSSWTVAGMDCTSVATNITRSMAGYNIGAYRITNLETTIAVYIGHDNQVSNSVTSEKVGEKLPAGSNGVWEIGKSLDLAQAVVKIWCRSASGTARLAVSVFGFK